uniref:Carrier domain-containing protein n=1 Tax=Chromera velia CCMP2878 TaxID=1169474 RepID=A0A0G4GLA0_9ALVE|eukprot:Cvel_680.t1-p1 / transcript=Cvel_680.t1 / gene=Cvel_680 / organism=Chromera_velia_CCMP2878 / gene_product=Erythronolide synthase, modules 3 and 4, putative / transcript_product=Erythronolide synthase, modules 3 and 4, putative / location=Cvel_scaffold21:40950-51160(+) / protein_length=2383 / sequence_SO=supercontig / SO=protein_coding / is_pseudo=false
MTRWDDLPAGPVGSDVAGTVVHVGSGVEGLREGDDVFGIASTGCLRTYVQTPADLLVRIPNRSLSFEDAASLPTCCATVELSLGPEGAALRSGQRVLCHAVTGGVGLFVVQYCKAVGASVVGTCSDGKRRAAEEAGVEFVSSSRDASSFRQDMFLWMERHGKVDVVINCLRDEFVPHSLEVLREGGVFVELGKGAVWSKERMRAARPDVKYIPVEWDTVAFESPVKARELLERTARKIHTGFYSPIPTHVFDMTREGEGGCVEAMKLMQRAQHIGKVVISVPSSLGKDRQAVAEGTVAITGGLGGLGLCFARWLQHEGSKNVLLLSRRKVKMSRSEKGLEKNEDWGMIVDAQTQTADGGGALSVNKVVTESCDVADIEQVRRVLSDEHLRTLGLPPVTGVLHSAGLLDDALIDNQSVEKIARVFECKARGAWNLHEVLGDRLRLFVLFSSIVSLWGNVGQVNYGAANYCLDALASFRRSRGLPCLTLNWGFWGEQGMGAESEDSLLQTGIRPLSSDLGRRVMADAMRLFGTSRDSDSQFALGAQPLIASRYAARTSEMPRGPYWSRVTIESDEAADLGAEELLGLSDEEIAERTGQHIIRTVSEGVSPGTAGGEWTLDTPLSELGMDSLAAVEVRNALQTRLSVSVPASVFLESETLRDISGFIAQKLIAKRDAAAAASGGKKKNTRPNSEQKQRQKKKRNTTPASGKLQPPPPLSSHPAVTAFLFTGQGSQWSGMGVDLYGANRVFREAIDEFSSFFADRLRDSHSELSLPVEITSDTLREVMHRREDKADGEGLSLNSALFAQPAIVAVELALLRVWETAAGVRPRVVIGHSLGEYAAAVAAGCLKWQTALALVIERARLTTQVPRGDGVMAAARVRAEDVRNAFAKLPSNIRPRVALAAVNGPSSVVVSGESAAVRETFRLLREDTEGEYSGKYRNLKTKELDVTHAFHSPLMDPVAKRFKHFLDSSSILSKGLQGTASIPPVCAPLEGVTWVSTVTGGRIGASSDELSVLRSSVHWRSHISDSVLFEPAMTTVVAEMSALSSHPDAPFLWVEVGPSSTLTSLAKACLPLEVRQSQRLQLWLSSMDKTAPQEAAARLEAQIARVRMHLQLDAHTATKEEKEAAATNSRRDQKEEKQELRESASSQPIRTSADAVAAPAKRSALLQAQALRLAPLGDAAQLVRELAFDRSALSPPAAPEDIRCVLLTGATGFVGRFVLRALLGHGRKDLPRSQQQVAARRRNRLWGGMGRRGRGAEFRVVCVVRGKSDCDAYERVRAACVESGVWDEGLIPGGRLEVLSGDLELPRMGLSEETWKRLTETVDAVYHVAAVLSLGKGYTRLKGPNLVSLKGVVALCTTAKLKHLFYTSTAAVWLSLFARDARSLESLRDCEAAWAPPSSSSDAATEDDLLLMERLVPPHVSGYIWTKVAAERVLRGLRERCGLPSVIFRLGSNTSIAARFPALGGSRYVQTLAMAAALKHRIMLPAAQPWVAVDTAAELMVRRLFTGHAKRSDYFLFDMSAQAQVVAACQQELFESTNLQNSFNEEIREGSLRDVLSLEKGDPSSPLSGSSMLLELLTSVAEALDKTATSPGPLERRNGVGGQARTSLVHAAEWEKLSSAIFEDLPSSDTPPWPDPTILAWRFGTACCRFELLGGTPPREPACPKTKTAEGEGECRGARRNSSTAGAKGLLQSSALIVSRTGSLERSGDRMEGRGGRQDGGTEENPPSSEFDSAASLHHGVYVDLESLQRDLDAVESLHPAFGGTNAFLSLRVWKANGLRNRLALSTLVPRPLRPPRQIRMESPVVVTGLSRFWIGVVADCLEANEALCLLRPSVSDLVSPFGAAGGGERWRETEKAVALALSSVGVAFSPVRVPPTETLPHDRERGLRGISRMRTRPLEDSPLSSRPELPDVLHCSDGLAELCLSPLVHGDSLVSSQLEGPGPVLDPVVLAVRGLHGEIVERGRRAPSPGRAAALYSFYRNVVERGCAGGKLRGFRDANRQECEGGVQMEGVRRPSAKTDRVFSRPLSIPDPAAALESPGGGGEDSEARRTTRRVLMCDVEHYGQMGALLREFPDAAIVVVDSPAEDAALEWALFSRIAAEAFFQTATAGRQREGTAAARGEEVRQNLISPLSVSELLPIARESVAHLVTAFETFLSSAEGVSASEEGRVQRVSLEALTERGISGQTLHTLASRLSPVGGASREGGQLRSRSSAGRRGQRAGAGGPADPPDDGITPRCGFLMRQPSGGGQAQKRQKKKTMWGYSDVRERARSRLERFLQTRRQAEAVVAAAAKIRQAFRSTRETKSGEKKAQSSERSQEGGVSILRVSTQPAGPWGDSVETAGEASEALSSSSTLATLARLLCSHDSTLKAEAEKWLSRSV